MLPITSPFDTYRVGYWALRWNAGLAAIYVAIMAVAELLVRLTGAEAMLFDIGLVGAVLFLVIYSAILFLILAMLIYPLHATLLSDGRISGLAAIEGFGRLARVGWRLFVIMVLALIPAVIVILVVAFALDPELSEPGMPGSQGGGHMAEILLIAATLGIYGLFFGLSIILFGPLIPDIVARTDATPGPSSFQMGTRNFRRMAANLAAGPGLVLLGYYGLWLGIVGAEPEEVAGGLQQPSVLVFEFAGLCIATYCSAMTAGVLSDTYRRAMATQVQLRAGID